MRRSTVGPAPGSAGPRGDSPCRSGRRWLCSRAGPPILSPASAAGPTGACSTGLEILPLDPLRVSERIALAIGTRLDIVAPWREAVRRALTVLALPQHAPLAMRLTYETIDGIWYAAGDNATDFSFYTKRLILAAIYSATVLYWLDDHSEGSADTRAFLDRRLADAARIGRARRDFATLVERLPNPFRLLRPLR